jgi:hypothetical protein
MRAESVTDDAVVVTPPSQTQTHGLTHMQTSQATWPPIEEVDPKNMPRDVLETTTEPQRLPDGAYEVRSRVPPLRSPDQYHRLPQSVDLRHRR